MSKKRLGKTHLEQFPTISLRDLSPAQLQQMEKSAEKYKKELKREERKRKRESHRRFVLSGVKAGFTVKQVLWIMKKFLGKNNRHWDGRVG